MPNRTHQSVKIRDRDRGKSVKAYWLIGGSVLAGLGALAVTLTGGQAGAVLGAVVFTVLIALQLSWLFGELKRATPAPRHQAAAAPSMSAAPASFRDPILVVSVSELGRVRSYWGRTDFLSGIKIGSDIAQFLPPDASSLDLAIGPKTAKLSVTRVPVSNGQLIVMLPAGQAGSDRNELLERTNFFAGLGHDLKSPLNAVIGFADVMDAEIRGPMPDAYREYPGLIRESGQTLLKLVEDMLGYARSEAGTYELDLAPMDIAASGESVLRQSQAVADKAGVRLVMTTDREVLALADAGAVRRIWDNLVSNAIKYSAPGDRVTLVSDVRNGKAFIQVRDQGAGMDADDLAKIAAPFAQGRNARGRAGTGLGLALVHRLAEMQNGTVEIATAPGAGTTVTVTLPALNGDQKRAAE